MLMTMRPRPRATAATLALATLVLALAACSGAGGASTAPTAGPTPRPTPTPIAAPASTAQEAAALVLATNPLFAGITELDPNLIGASRWWEATPLEGGGWTIKVTVGWGDCPAGCIERHVWTHEVTPDGTVKLVSEEGDPVPQDLPA